MHARNKRLDPAGIDWQRVARACGGMTGADLANVLNEAAITAARSPAGVISEAVLLDTVEKLDREASVMRRHGSSELTSGDAEANLAALPARMKRAVAGYEAGKALTGLLTPFYDELMKVVVFPGGQPVGYTYFLPREAHLESGIMSRGYLEACLTVLLAGRCAEVLLRGPQHTTAQGAGDLADASAIARQMVMRYGFNESIGPVALMGGLGDSSFLGKTRTPPAAEMSFDLARRVQEEVRGERGGGWSVRFQPHDGGLGRVAA